MRNQIHRIIAATTFLITSLLGNSPQPNTSAPAHLIKFNPNPPLKRTISLDTGYVPSLNSNRAVGEFDLELRQAWGCAYDYFYNRYQPTTVFGRMVLYGLFNAVTWGPTMGQMATYHELGHSTRFRSIGIDTSFVNITRAAWSVCTKKKEKLNLEDVLSDGYFPTFGGTILINGPLPIVWILSAVMPRYDRPALFKPAQEDNHYQPEVLKLFKTCFAERLKKNYDLEKDKDVIRSEDLKLKVLQEDVFVPATDALIMAGGLNNQQDQCRRVEKNLWYSGGDHFTTVGTYFWDKTWAGFQSFSSSGSKKKYEDGQDTYGICNAYYKMGIHLTHEDIIKYSYLSYFLSAQTYANIYQIYQTLTTGENRVYAPEYRNIKLPNVGLYFTSKGPTYNISSGYRVHDDLFIPVSIEIGLKKIALEATIGLRKKFPATYESFIHVEVTFNPKAIGGSIYGGLIWDKIWNVQGGIIYHNSKTFQGERNIPSYKSGDTDVEAWLKLGVVY